MKDLVHQIREAATKEGRTEHTLSTSRLTVGSYMHNVRRQASDRTLPREYRKELEQRTRCTAEGALWLADSLELVHQVLEERQARVASERSKVESVVLVVSKLWRNSQR